VKVVILISWNMFIRDGPWIDNSVWVLERSFAGFGECFDGLLCRIACQ